MNNAVREARYILADVEANSNKFWHITVHGDHSCVTCWGRVGEAGQQKAFPFSSPEQAEAFFQRKRAEKERKGYVPQRTLGAGGPSGARVAQLALDQIETDCLETRRLVARLAHANVHDILAQTSLRFDEKRGTFSTPLGIVTADAIVEARSLLECIGTCVAEHRYDDPQMANALNTYLMLVPQNIGRARPDPRALYPNLDAIRAQHALLDNLDASLQVATSKSDEDAPEPRLFQAKVAALTDDSELARLRALYAGTAQPMHASSNLRLVRAYHVEIAGMREAFERRGRRVGNVQELWHGTRTANLLSILKSGFIIPPSNAPHVTGRMFGNGVYFSDQSTKSLNYAHGYWAGRRDPNCFMLLCRVALGRSWTPTGPTSFRPPFFYHSVFAKAGASGVVNNEMIVFNTDQVDPVYLAEFAPPGAVAA